ncbi:Ribonuclease H-like domain containing protein [Melia azedarach]|uniref:Ribonuclease H-like domain containing protein n=1 Tax=Melia azedarach TaxID=155640 RepID=A0ACC1YIZ0_MELAZ|nr:Ribonuclease H-like domain containing protein [Melia azedarach]
MESEKLVQLCQSLSLLEEEEKTIVVDRSITKLGEEKLTNSLVVVSWFIWKQRNTHLHNNKFERPEQTLSKAESFLEVYQAATRNKVSPNVQLPMPSSTAIWSPPGSGLKLNVDATVNNQKGQAGLGYIIRNSSGVVMAAASTKRACLGSLEVA